MKLFVDKLKNFLLEDHYQVIPTDVNYVHMFGQPKQNKLYLLNIIVLEKDTMISKTQYALYKEITKKQFSALGYDVIYLLNLYLTTESDRHCKEWDEMVPDYHESFVDFHWFVDPEQKIIRVPKNQPSKYLNIQEILKAIFEQRPYETKSFVQLKTNKTPMTYGLILINCIVWLFMEWTGSTYDHETLINYGALYSPAISRQGEYYRLVTAIFLHIGFSHLLYNMSALYILGGRVEKVLGWKKFTLLYLLAGLAGSILSYGVALGMGITKLAAGASGAIYGLQGAALYTLIHHKGTLEGITKGWLFVATFGGLIFGILFYNVDNMAHIGGLLTGYIFMHLID